jgi:hypothetical protein
MGADNKKRLSTGVSLDRLSKTVPGIEADLIKRVSEYFDERLDRDNSPIYVFLKPDLEAYSKVFSRSEKEIYGVLAYLAAFRRDVIQLKKVLVREERNLFYILQDEDVLELQEKNQIHDPDDPRIVYENADRIIRHAFVLDPEGEVLC